VQNHRRGHVALWRTLGRNKKCVSLDLRSERGSELARCLAERADVLIENFRPGHASVCEGVGGLRFVNGIPGERRETSMIVPIRPQLLRKVDLV
jgi:crotonobetainyl-CoA:carnitine CoA-transferase CaiB-like acyl-CoA transferase